MKKLLTFALALVLALTTLCFVACGEDEGDPTPPPAADVTYEMYSLTNAFTTAGTTDTFVVGDEMGEGGPVLTADYMTMTFKADGTCTSTMKDLFDNQVETATGTYTLSGNTYTITFEGDTQTATVDGDNLTISYSQFIEQMNDTLVTTMVFKKVVANA